MLHNEARKLLIQALEKTHNAKEVAENFSVNRGTVYRLKRQLEKKQVQLKPEPIFADVNQL